MMNFFFFVFLQFSLILGSQDTDRNQLTILNANKNTSLRGVSVVDEKTAWVSGSNGWVGKTINKGESWEWFQIDSAEDYRTLYAINDQEAIIANAGSPLRVYKTKDGGENWLVVYENDHEEIFIDGGDFLEDGYGLLYGDPIGGRFQFLSTSNFGDTWENISEKFNVNAEEGEAGFAASGTGMRLDAEGNIVLASGGKVSRVFISNDFGENWNYYNVSLQQGSSSQGIFSLDFLKTGQVWIVGGNYLDDSNKNQVAAKSEDFGKTWRILDEGPFGYRSSVEILDEKGQFLLACGTSGVDFSINGGLHWNQITSEGYHIIKKSRKGNWIILAGSNGKITEFNLSF